MKKWIVSALLLAFFFGNDAMAAVRQTSIDLTPFKSVSVAGPFSVSFVRGSDYRALVSVEEGYMDYVVCSVTGTVLTIDLDERRVPADVKRQYKGKGTPDPVFSAVVYVPELVQSVTLKDKAVLCDTEDVFDKAKVVFELKDNASAKQMDLSSQNVRIVMQNKSVADFKVNCKLLETETNNSSSLSIDETSEESAYSLQGSSKIVAKSRSSQVSVKTKSNSNMILVGAGDNISFNLSGTSEVNAVDFEVPDAKVSMTSVCQLSLSAYRSLTLNLNGGSSVYFRNDPQVTIENIKSSTVSRISDGKNSRL